MSFIWRSWHTHFFETQMDSHDAHLVACIAARCSGDALPGAKALMRTCPLVHLRYRCCYCSDSRPQNSS
jgi:hypothetical protein